MKLIVRLSIILIASLISLNSRGDIAKIASEFNNKNLRSAITISNHHNYKDIHQFLLTQKFIDGTGQTSFDEIISFLDKHEGWPQAHLLGSTAENNINSSTSKTKIIGWFEHNKPKTKNGFYHHYLAAISRIKDTKKLQSIIKSTWVNYKFSKKDEKTFLTKHKNILTPDDHADKISELIWSGEIRDAEGLFYLVDKNYQQAFRSWIELTKNNKNSEILFHKIKGSYKYHSGLLYSYLKLHMKTPPNNELINLYLKAPQDEKHSKEWWKLKNYFARELFKEQKFQDAYRIISKHKFFETADIIEAEWFAGWIALRYIKNPKNALQHFAAIYSHAKSAISLSRASYWMGRSHKELGNKELSNEWFKKSASYGYTFYSQLAQDEMGYKNLNLGPEILPTPQDKKQYEANPIAKIAVFLSHTSRKELLNLYAKEAFYRSKTKGEAKLIYDKIAPQLDLHWKVEIAKLAQQAGILLLNKAFPAPYQNSKIIQNKILAHAIIRQESVFDQYAISSANAHGLMQIIPSTAKILAKNLGAAYNLKKLTSSSEYNLRLGSYYLEQLMKEHDNSYILTASNYNAGPVISKWKTVFGDPKKMQLYKVIDFIESIPYYETRNYVQRILENMQIYRYIITKDKRLHIKNDLIQSEP